MSLRMSRRDLLVTAAAGACAAPLPFFALRAAAAAPVQLVAGRRTLDINGRAASVYGLAQPNGTRGIITEVGTPFRVRLQNDTGEETLIHWHGLIPPYQQDGVPGLSAPLIAPGGSARYDFPLNFPGTFFMHSHQAFQEQLLMSAPLIIRAKREAADRQEIVLMLHDFSFRSPGEIFADLLKPVPPATAQPMSGMAMPMDLNDVQFDAFLANDRTLSDPEIVSVERRGRILLRVINAAASSNFIIDLGKTHARLVAVDGRPVQAVTASMFPIAMAQRLDLQFELGADQAVLPIFARLEGAQDRSGIVLAARGAPVPKLSALADDKAPPVVLGMEVNLRAAIPLKPRLADRIHQIDLTGSMKTYAWGLNGLQYGHDQPLMVAKGERVELVMTNRTMMSHPMHLHGHAFQVVAIDGRRFAGAVRDTVLVPPKQSVTVAFDANSPGRWAFHCHNLYHMEAGMMTTVQYEVF